MIVKRLAKSKRQLKQHIEMIFNTQYNSLNISKNCLENWKKRINLPGPYIKTKIKREVNRLRNLGKASRN